MRILRWLFQRKKQQAVFDSSIFDSDSDELANGDENMPMYLQYIKTFEDTIVQYRSTKNKRNRKEIDLLEEYLHLAKTHQITCSELYAETALIRDNLKDGFFRRNRLKKMLTSAHKAFFKTHDVHFNQIDDSMRTERDAAFQDKADKLQSDNTVLKMQKAALKKELNIVKQDHDEALAHIRDQEAQLAERIAILPTLLQQLETVINAVSSLQQDAIALFSSAQESNQEAAKNIALSISELQSNYMQLTETNDADIDAIKLRIEKLAAYFQFVIQKAQSSENDTGPQPARPRRKQRKTNITTTPVNNPVLTEARRQFKNQQGEMYDTVTTAANALRHPDACASHQRIVEHLSSLSAASNALNVVDDIDTSLALDALAELINAAKSAISSLFNADEIAQHAELEHFNQRIEQWNNTQPSTPSVHQLTLFKPDQQALKQLQGMCGPSEDSTQGIIDGLEFESSDEEGISPKSLHG